MAVPEPNITYTNFIDIGIDDLQNEEKYFQQLNNTTSENFITKIINENGKMIKILECKICHKKFPKVHIIQRHLLTHEKNYSCSNCNKKFHLKTTLNQHYAIHSNVRPYRCEHCVKSFNRVSTLIAHRKTHGDVKLFACPFCRKSFHQKGNLKNHIYTHTDLRPYKCNYCERGFNQMSNLVCHMKKFHSDQVIDPWSCTICQMKFSKRIDLRAHEFEIHQNKIDLQKPSEKLYSRKNAGFIDQEEEFDYLLSIIKERSEDFFPTHSTNLEKNYEIPVTPPTAIIIKSIQTEAMKTARRNHEIPFAVLHFLHGQPLLVRCIDIDNKTMLRPTSQEDIEILKAKYKSSMNIPIVARIYQTANSGESVFEIRSPKNIYLFPNPGTKNHKKKNSIISKNVVENIKENLNLTTINKNDTMTFNLHTNNTINILNKNSEAECNDTNKTEDIKFIGHSELILPAIKQDYNENIPEINLKSNSSSIQDNNWFKKFEIDSENFQINYNIDNIQTINYNEELIKCNADANINIKPLNVLFGNDIDDSKKCFDSEVEFIQDMMENNNNHFQDNTDNIIVNQTYDENDINLFKHFLQGTFNECEPYNDIIAGFFKT